MCICVTGETVVLGSSKLYLALTVWIAVSIETGLWQSSYRVVVLTRRGLKETPTDAEFGFISPHYEGIWKIIRDTERAPLLAGWARGMRET